MEKQSKPHIKNGLMVAAILIIADLLLFATNNKITNNFWLNEATPLLIFTGCLLSILLEKAIFVDKGWSVKFGFGFKVAAVAVALFFIYATLTTYFIFPDFLTNLFDSKIEEAKKMKGFSSKEVEANAAMAKKVLGITYMSSTVLRHLAAGLAGSAVGAVLKSSKK
jgi:hypothetical protein